MIKLRSYQQKCIDGVRLSFKKVNSTMLVAPTGAGKTVMFAYIAKAASERGNKVLIMAHRKELCIQCGDKLINSGLLDFGYINPPFTPDYTKKIQVGTIQSIISRIGKLKQIGWQPNIIIIDEAHRTLAQTYLDIIATWPNAKLLGVTATPVRGDKKALSIVYKDLVLGPKISELIRDGYLVRPRTFGPEQKIDLTNVKLKRNGEYDLKSLEKAVDQVKITGDAVDHYTRICPGVPAIAFCVSIKHAKHVAEEFAAAGYKCAHIDGDMTPSERKQRLDGLADGTYNILTSVDLVTEGVDIPMAQCAIMLRPTKSVGLFIQMVGRVLRLFDGKYCAYVLDHAGLSSRHGFIEKDREWTLDGIIKDDEDNKDTFAKEKATVKQCPNCFKMHLIAPKCDNCGHVYDVRSRQVDLIDGQLVELNILNSGSINISEADKQLLNDLRKLATKSGYSDDWAVEVFNDAVGRGLV